MFVNLVKEHKRGCLIFETASLFRLYALDYFLVVVDFLAGAFFTSTVF